MIKKIRTLFSAKIFAMLLCCCALVEYAAATHYKAIATGAWTSASTWQSGNVPPAVFTGGDIVEIPSGFTVTAGADVRFRGNSKADKMIINGALLITANTLRIDGAVFEGNGVVQADSFGGDFSRGFDYGGSVTANRMDGTSIVANTNVSLNAGRQLYAARSMVLNTGSLTIGPGCLIRLVGARLYTAVLQIGHAANITFNGPYDVTYEGQGLITGVELTNSRLRNVELNLSATNGDLILNSNLHINDTLTLRRGFFDMGGKNILLGTTANFRAIGQSAFKGFCPVMTISATNALLSPLQFHETIACSFDTFSINTGNTIKIKGMLMIPHYLDLANGKLEILTGQIRIPAAQSDINHDRNRYIITNNNLVTTYIQPNNTLTFPVGTETQYLPVTISTRATSKPDIGVNVVNGVRQFGTSGAEWHKTKPLVNATWHVYSIAIPTTDFDIRVDWPQSAEVNGFDRSSAYIAQMLDNKWDSYAPAPAQFNATIGKYYISRANMDTSNTEIAVFDKNTVGIKDAVTQKEIILHPNPATNALYIDIQTTAEVRVYNTTGQLLQQATVQPGNSTVNISALAPGMYYIQLQADNVNATGSFIKQ